MRHPKLTQRELAVLRHVQLAETNREIARALAVSEVAVKAHVQRLMGKYNVTNRTALVVATKYQGRDLTLKASNI